MIAPDQLAAALARLAPRDREVLDLSLRRRVPDEALAKIFECEAPEVARRRASAIEHLADDLGVQRGEDLGSVLKALLEQDTWDSAEGAGPADEEAAPDSEQDDKPAKAEPPELKTSEAARLFRLPPTPPPAIEEAPRPAEAPEEELAPVVAEAEDLAQAHGPARPHVTGRPEKPASAAGAAGNDPPREREPVLDMLADREQERRRERVRTPLLWAIGGGLAAACLFGAGFLGATQFGDEAGRDEGGGNDAPRRFVPDQRGPLAAPFPSDPNAASCYTTAFVRRPVRLHQSPGSRRTLRLPARTEWGSARVFSVVRRRGSWLAVQAPELKNGEVGWIRAESAKLDCMRLVAARRPVAPGASCAGTGAPVRRLRDRHRLRRNPTPKGRFAVTDKLKVTDPGSPYGCCVLALTRPPDRPPAATGRAATGWPCTPRATSARIGKPVSLGCMRARPTGRRWLIDTIPLGSPIFIRSVDLTSVAAATL